MECPQCGLSNREDSAACVRCHTPLPGVTPSFPADRTITSGVSGSTGSSGSATGVRRSQVPARRLEAGDALGGRYEILQQLGAGGMGAVYKVRDRELERIVAIKVILPDLAQDRESLSRFKKEIIIASQVTHKNVSRIYDFAEADGVKFITMEYVEGRTLSRLLRERGKFPPKEAAGLITQVLRALEAAHSEGVIHRDLKPQNIMVDPHGKAVVMDFGIARSLDTSNMTKTGALLGTPAYMSPEQAKGEKLDARSDLFAVGIIFYELLTGDSPYKADTTLEMMYKRTAEAARPPIELAPEIPKALNDIVVRCLQMDREKRYQSAGEILNDLEAWAGTKFGTRVVTVPASPASKKLYWISSLALLALLAAAGIAGYKYFSRPVPHKEMSVLVADFDNQTADSLFNETLEPAFIIGLEGAPFIQSYDRKAAHQLAGQLSPGAKTLDESNARLVSTREGIDVIVAGTIAKEGNRYAIHVKAIDGITGKDIVAKTAQADKQNVLASIGRLSADVRSALGDTTPESVKLAAQETFTAETLEAAHSYSLAQALQQQGKWDEAFKEYQHSIQLDPEFGRAFAGLAIMELNLGHRKEADNYFKLALAHVDRMTDREKYRTRGGYYLLIGDWQKAIEEYSLLVQSYPGDTVGTSNLAFAYFDNRDLAKAMEIGKRAADMNPGSAPQRGNLALYALYAGDFANAATQAQAALKLNPKYDAAVRALALAQLAQGQNAQAAATYQSLAGLSARGFSMASTGFADIALYEGRLNEAVPILEKGIAADLVINDKLSAGRKEAILAGAQIALGEKAAAVAHAEKAVAMNQDDTMQFTAAMIYLEGGKAAPAHAISAAMAKQLQSDPQIYAKLIEGQSRLHDGDAQGAIQLFSDAQKLSDTWLGRFYLGRAYLDAGNFQMAATQFEACRQRRGEATSVFLDDEPSYRQFPPVLYYLGRAQEGVQSGSGADSFKAFLAIKTKATNDPLVADANKRVSGAH